jgi:transcriptional regulator with XRE-family HTH domain
MKKSPSLVKSQLTAFGANLKQHRLAKGWTLDDLAKRSGLSKPFLSRLESGGRKASIAAVLTLSEIFGVSLASMFETHTEMEPCLVVRRTEAEPREALGLSYTVLSQAGRNFNLRPIKVTVSLDRGGNEHFRHDGEEWIYVLSGKLTLSLAGQTYDLNVGDAVHFDSRLPHRIIARGKVAPEILLVASPLEMERRAATGALMPGKSKRAIPLLELNDNRELSSPS